MGVSSANIVDSCLLVGVEVDKGVKVVSLVSLGVVVSGGPGFDTTNSRIGLCFVGTLLLWQLSSSLVGCG